MADHETTTESAATETKKIINPRVEIDTSPPFESVKEAVDRFGGSGPWIPHHLLRLAAWHHENEVFDAENMEQQAVQLEKDLITKERETLNVLKELEEARRFVEGFKVNLMQEMSSFMATPDMKFGGHMTITNENSTDSSTLCPVPSPGLMFMELNQAKTNLNKTSVDLAVIRASVESLNKKMRRERVPFDMRTKNPVPDSGQLSIEENHNISKVMLDVNEKIEAMKVSLENSVNISEEDKQVNFEAEQFKKMTEASKYEVMKAMAEIERTKNSIKMAEMRLNAAKKMEEAAKAVEAIARAEKRALLNGDNSGDVLHHKSDGITLSFEEYKALTQKAKQAEELCKTKFIDTNRSYHTKKAHQSEVAIMEKFEETTKENRSSEFTFSTDEGLQKTEVFVEDHFATPHSGNGLMQNLGNHLSKFRFRNSHSSLGHRNAEPPSNEGDESYVKKERSEPGSRSATSIGDILSKKLILQDDYVIGKHVENHNGKQHVSLSQMLREQSRLILHPTKPDVNVPTAEVNVEKQFFMQRKKFGFIQVPIPKHNKKKTQPLNMR